MNDFFENSSKKNEVFFNNFWGYNDIIKALQLISVNSENFYNGFSIDSRSIVRGQVFIALHGKNFNGHDFICDAFNHGASLAIVDEENKEALSGKNYILVDDTKIALHNLAKYSAKKSNATLLGITGSCGKTTVKSWVAELLSIFGETVSSFSNYNNEIGLPFSMTNLKEGSKFGVFEVGISHPNEMANLSKILNPDIAVILKICNSHIGNFSSLKELMDEKSKIIDGLKESGKLIVDYGNIEKFPSIIQDAYLKKNVEIIMVSSEPFIPVSKSYAFIKEVVYDKQRLSSKVLATIGGLPIEYFVPFQNLKLIYSTFISFLTALLTLFKEETLEEIIEKGSKDIDSLIFKISQLAPLEGRGEILTLSKNGFYFKLIDDAYNANLESMLCGIETINKFETVGKKIAVIGEMMELGENSFADHQKLCEELSNSKIDLIIFVGNVFKNYKDKIKNKEAIFFNSEAEIPNDFWDIIKGNDVILIKGSNSTNLHSIVSKLKIKYSKTKMENKISGMVA